MKKLLLAGALVLMNSVALMAQNQSSFAPRVTTYYTVARGVNFALGRLTVTGSNITEEGFCYSDTNPEPTINDNLHTDILKHNGNIYRMQGLKPQTIYYVRAYAKNAEGEVGYGKVVKIATLKESNATYTYNFGAGDAANKRIDNALKEAIEYYHRCTNIQGYNVRCTYNAGVPTADCYYGGTIRVGAVESYQATGTLLHEMNHGVGVGQVTRWMNSSDLRSGTTTGNWLGERANNMVRFFDNNESSVLKGDNQHMWPYGINGAFEDEHTEIQYLANAMITQALGEDGLQPTHHVNASPSYTFTQTDGVKYYIKGECPGLGLEDGYVTDDNGEIRWHRVNGLEALNDDAYAWYVTFDAVAEAYYIQNVKSGRYISVARKNGNGENLFTMAAKDKPSTTERVQLLGSRKPTTISTGGGTFEGKAYWLTYPELNAWGNPPTLQAEENGYIQTTGGFEFGNRNTNQRWLFLTEKEVNKLDYVARRGVSQRFVECIEGTEALLRTPHTTTAENTDEGLQEAIKAAKEFLAAPIDTIPYSQKQEELFEAIRVFMLTSAPASEDAPYDLTFMLENGTASEDYQGWDCDTEYWNGLFESANTKFTVKQLLPIKFPKGRYAFLSQGFTRPGTLDKLNAVIYPTVYLRSNTTKLCNILDGASESPLSDSDILVDGKYIPNTLEGAKKYFDADKYWNKVEVVLTNDNTIRFNAGVKSTINRSDTWTVFGNFKLYGYGNTEADAIETVTSDDAEAPIYDLSGRRVIKAVKGIYIVGGKKVVK